MARNRRPVGVTIIAIFNLVLGIPCLLGSLCAPFVEDITVAMVEAMPKPPANQQAPDPVKMIKEQQEFMKKEVPAQKPAMIAFAILQLTYSLLLLVSGIAILGGKPIGRKLGIVAAVLMALTTLGNTAFGALFVVPATSKWEQQQAKAQPQATPQMAAISGAGGLACSAILGLGYSAAALIVLLGGPSRQYFSGAANGEPDDFDDRERDEYDDRFRAGPDYDDR